MSGPHFWLEIENNLYGDADGAYRREINRQLAAMRARVQAGLRVQSDPKNFRELQAALRAVEAAAKIMTKYGLN